MRYQLQSTFMDMTQFHLHNSMKRAENTLFSRGETDNMQGWLSVMPQNYIFCTQIGP